MSQLADNSSVLESETIIDTDIHLDIPVSDLAAYCDEPYSSYAERIVLADTSWDPSLGGKMHQDERVSTPGEIRRNVMERFHVDYPIVNSFTNVGRISNSDAAVALMRACNDLVLDRFLDDTDLVGLATIAPQDPAACAEELDRIGQEDSIVGVFVVTAGPRTPLGDSSYDIMYQAAQDNDLPLVYHAATKGGFDREFPHHNQAFEQFIEAHICSHLWCQTMTLTSLVIQGVPVKFPDLDFVILESGLTWVPYMMFRLNKEYSMRRSEAPLLEKSPEEYVRERFYFASQPLGEPDSPRDLQQVLDVLGPEMLLFATDYPHWDFDHPSELDKHLRAHFSEEERRQVLFDNASKVFGIPA
ncbi:MAG: amidohydrolase family protein [Halobacteriota archaeon]